METKSEDEGTSNDIVLRASDVSLSYVVKTRRPDRRRLGFTRVRSSLHVLSGINFAVSRGERVAVIGRNGAGKSSLIRVCSGGQIPSSGSIEVAGNPIKVSTTAPMMRFSSGMKNIELGLLARGVQSTEMNQLLRQAAEFTELGEALHQPLATYSAGMKARIKFAVATSIEPDLLLIDEGLSAGDTKFNAKARSRIEELVLKSGALVMVSHSKRQILDFCTRGMVLKGGVLVFDGDVQSALSFYDAEC